jgi:hypothetical protein
MDIPPVAPAPKAVKAAPAPVVDDPVAQDVTVDSDDLPPPPPPPAPKAEPKREAKKEVVKEAAPAPAPAEDINAKIDDILSGMSL